MDSGAGCGCTPVAHSVISVRRLNQPSPRTLEESSKVATTPVSISNLNHKPVFQHPSLRPLSAGAQEKSPRWCGAISFARGIHLKHLLKRLFCVLQCVCDVMYPTMTTTYQHPPLSPITVPFNNTPCCNPRHTGAPHSLSTSRGLSGT